ncbi:DgyrCDS8180 [Dimorphilus gyrociliatus]|uniref:DgyrCDS8180 n=1 Tax=Dimorphilus gyrociliatus TaxID=2664684 RepID=A0A7I8VYI2_9ANNE|nr:DgyrCDS8180 [Dimorphilus gyrociliatus]
MDEKENGFCVEKLERLCLNYIVRFPSILQKQKMADNDFFLTTYTATPILTLLGEIGRLTDENVRFFNRENTCLNAIKLACTEIQEVESYKFLKGHCLEAIQFLGLKNYSQIIFDNYIDITKLKYFSLQWCHIYFEDCSYFSKYDFSNLKVLDVSFTDFTNSHFINLIQSAINLENINLTSTFVTNIEKLEYLKCLKVYIHRRFQQETNFHPLLAVKSLIKLDIGFDSEDYNDKDIEINTLLFGSSWPNLQYLDISGRWIFLRKHPRLHFLDLMRVICTKMTFAVGIKVVTDWNLNQIIDALNYYRNDYMKSMTLMETFSEHYHHVEYDYIQQRLDEYSNYIKSLTLLLDWWNKNIVLLQLHEDEPGYLHILLFDQIKIFNFCPEKLPLNLLSFALNSTFDYLDNEQKSWRMAPYFVSFLTTNNCFIVHHVCFDKFKAFTSILSFISKADDIREKYSAEGYDTDDFMKQTIKLCIYFIEIIITGKPNQIYMNKISISTLRMLKTLEAKIDAKLFDNLFSHLLPVLCSLVSKYNEICGFLFVGNGVDILSSYLMYFLAKNSRVREEFIRKRITSLLSIRTNRHYGEDVQMSAICGLSAIYTNECRLTIDFFVCDFPAGWKRCKGECKECLNDLQRFDIGVLTVSHLLLKKFGKYGAFISALKLIIWVDSSNNQENITKEDEIIIINMIKNLTNLETEVTVIKSLVKWMSEPLHIAVPIMIIISNNIIQGLKDCKTFHKSKCDTNCTCNCCYWVHNQTHYGSLLIQKMKSWYITPPTLLANEFISRDWISYLLCEDVLGIQIFGVRMLYLQSRIHKNEFKKIIYEKNLINLLRVFEPKEFAYVRFIVEELKRYTDC